MARYHLAQLNIARFRKPIEDPVNADFVNNLDRVNAVAEAQPGFVWRLVGDGNDATDVQAYDDPNIAVNLSVWESLDDLVAFAYRNTDHLQIMRRRKEWFEKMDFYLVLWWVPAGHEPSIEEARAKLEYLEANGPSVDAFTFAAPYSQPGTLMAPVEDKCA